MKLLVPVDGSTASLNAAKKAVELAKKDGYEIKMITVIKPEDFQAFKRYSKIWQRSDGSIFDKNIKPIDDNEAARRMTRMAHELLKTIAHELNAGSVPLDLEVLLGEPYEKIIEIANDENVDMIVMGNRGFSKIKRFFVGSVAQRVIAEAPCPVLVIHTDVKN